MEGWARSSGSSPSPQIRYCVATVSITVAVVLSVIIIYVVDINFSPYDILIFLLHKICADGIFEDLTLVTVVLSL